MPSKNKTGDIFAGLILVVLLSTSICEALYTSLFLTNKLNMMVFLTIIPLSFLFAVMFKNKITGLISSIMLVLLLILGTTYVIYLMGMGRGEKFFAYINWFIDLVNGYPEFSKKVYSNITIIVMSFIVTLLVYLFTVKFYNFYLLSFFALSVFFVQLQFKILNSQSSFILFIFSFLLLYLYNVLRNRIKDKRMNSGSILKYLVFVIPFCLIIVVVSLQFPVRNTRISWPWLDKKADTFIVNTSDAINERFFDKDMSAFDYFSLDATGFGKSDRLGGNIKLDKKQVMNVRSEFSNLYLKGSSKAFYDGHRWYDDSNSFTGLFSQNGSFNPYTGIENDYDEFKFGNFVFNGLSTDEEILKNSSADIEYTNLKTKSLFIPVKAYLITPKNHVNLFADNEQMISSNEILADKFSYTISYDNLNLNSNKLKSMLRKSYKNFYTITIQQYLIKQVQNKESGIKKEDVELTVNHYQEKLNNIYSRYTTLPETITPRTRQLSADITKDSPTNYDKAKAIETYLSQNYPYTLSPGKPPRGQDFVDYFLFDGKKGYCTYYASAMTVLLRCLDIPARYVEGYILPPSPENGGFKVTNQQAHAWVEVYFEGFGWIPFEPTSPFVSNMYSDRTISANISSDMSDQDYNDYMDMINQYSDTDMSDIPLNTNTADSSNEKNDKITLLMVVINIVLVLSICIVLLILILAGTRTIRYRRFINKIEKSDSNETAVLMLYQYILNVLQVLKISYKPGETPSEFGERVEKQLDFRGYTFGKNDFIKITNYFINARYSKDPVSHADKQNMLEFLNILMKLIKEKISQARFILYKYITGKL